MNGMPSFDAPLDVRPVSEQASSGIARAVKGQGSSVISFASLLLQAEEEPVLPGAAEAAMDEEEIATELEGLWPFGGWASPQLSRDSQLLVDQDGQTATLDRVAGARHYFESAAALSPQVTVDRGQGGPTRTIENDLDNLIHRVAQRPAAEHAHLVTPDAASARGTRFFHESAFTVRASENPPGSLRRLAAVLRTQHADSEADKVSTAAPRGMFEGDEVLSVGEARVLAGDGHEAGEIEPDASSWRRLADLGYAPDQSGSEVLQDGQFQTLGANRSQALHSPVAGNIERHGNGLVDVPFQATMAEKAHADWILHVRESEALQARSAELSGSVNLGPVGPIEGQENALVHGVEGGLAPLVGQRDSETFVSSAAQHEEMPSQLEEAALTRAAATASHLVGTGGPVQNGRLSETAADSEDGIAPADQLKFAAEHDDIEGESVRESRPAGQVKLDAVRTGERSHGGGGAEGNTAEADTALPEAALHEPGGWSDSEGFLEALRDGAGRRTSTATGLNRSETPRFTASLQPESLSDVVRAVSLEGRERPEAVRVELHPRELGRLHLRVAVENGSVNAQIAAESEAVRQAIEAALPQLRQSLQESGLDVGSLQVFVGTDGGGFGRSQERSQELPTRINNRRTAEGRISYRPVDGRYDVAREDTGRINVLA